MKFLDGYKEKIAGSIGGLLLILASWGIAADWMKPLEEIAAAVNSGNWTAAGTAFVGGLAILMRVFYRMAQDRKDGE